MSGQTLTVRVPLRLGFDGPTTRGCMTAYEGVTVRHADGVALTRAVELVTRHDLSAKAYTGILYAVTYEEGPGYRMTGMEVVLGGPRKASMVRLGAVPAARFSRATADRVHAAWREQLEAALDDPEGMAGLANAAAWVREVTA